MINKTITAILLAAVTAISAAACAGQTSSGSSAPAQEPAQAQESAQVQEPAATEDTTAEETTETSAENTAETPAGEAVPEDAVQEKTAGVYTPEVPEEPLELPQPLPAYMLFGDFYAENYKITAEDIPDVLSSIENLSYRELTVKRLKRQVAAVPVFAKFTTANEFKSETVWLRTQADWDKLYETLNETDPETADQYMENVHALCDTWVAELSFAEESGRVHSWLRYVVTFDGKTMNLVPMERIRDDYTIEYTDTAASESMDFDVEFCGDAIVLRSGDCAVRLYPYQTWKWFEDSTLPYVMIAAAASDEAAYGDLVYINASWKDAFSKEADFVQLYFKDGSYTDIVTAEAVFSEGNTLTFTWEKKVRPDQGTVDDPGQITVHYLSRGGALNSAVILIDEEGNLYPYLSTYDEYLDHKEAQ